MSIPKRSSAPGTYFVTTGCWNKKSIFQVTRNADLFLDVLNSYRKHFLLHGFVVMPDHVHLLLTPLDITLERTMQYIKGGFSFRLSKELGIKMEVWQRGFIDHRIRNQDDFQTRLNYIHQNPIRAGLADQESRYAYSSACGLWTMDPLRLVSAAKAAI